MTKDKLERMLDELIDTAELDGQGILTEKDTEVMKDEIVRLVFEKPDDQDLKTNIKLHCLISELESAIK